MDCDNDPKKNKKNENKRTNHGESSNITLT